MNRRMRIPLLVLVAGVMAVAAHAPAWSQGCVVARGAGMSQSHAPGSDGESVAGRFEASVAYRYLNSDRHFVGSEEQEERRHEGSQVVNHSNFFDVSLGYTFNDRLSATLTCPFARHDRSSTVRRNDPQRTILTRYHTQNAGLADVRLMGNMWMLDPKTHADGNILLGLGVEIPTGKDDAEDTFRAFDAESGQIVPVRRTVDQSIQLGDGGWALLLDVFAYRQLNSNVSLYGNAFYAVTPEEKNGVSTFRGNPFESEMSIADSFMARTGVDVLLWPQHGLTFSLGVRAEGVPVRDLVGGSDGFRRPGYAVSIEPGLSARFGATSAIVYMPLAVYRNRTRSVADQRWTDATGVYRHGDAAFADQLLMMSIGTQF